MDFGKLRFELNIIEQAKKYGIPVWQHPQFLFLVMGIIIVFSSIFSYSLGTRYIEDPHVVALSIITLTLVLLVLAFIITRSFERLAEVSRLKSEFVSIVSHQLRTPLSNMKWIADLLVSERSNEDRKEYFLMLKENASRMQELINDLLTVSRIEEGGLVTKREEFSFINTVKEVAVNFQPMMQAMNIVLDIQDESKSRKVFADPSQIQQVVSNLFNNAIKYTGKTKTAVLKGKGKKHVITIHMEDKGKNLRFEIKDTGVGIPREDQKYIFEKFFRSGNVLRHETQGSGLGLYIAKAIIKRSKGEIGFESKEHKGSTFWFTLPYAS
ncbi:HAMP domain-containing histidine kinase [Patescibacteria group bacterium]|nr:HAMP domain-containing histidine kinase [Patescibacteria group bacterium]